MDRHGRSQGGTADAEGLIVQRLDDELLVYDTASDEAHCLDPAAAAEFEAAPDDVSRREVIRKLALVGAAAAGAAPLIRTIVTPAAAQAQSSVPCSANAPCTSPMCCSTGGVCVANGTACSAGTICTNGTCVVCGHPTGPCCAGNSCPPNGCCDNGVCVSLGVNCSTGAPCCDGGICCASGQTCPSGTCVTPVSDRNLKHHLAPVEPQDVLAALG